VAARVRNPKDFWAGVLYLVIGIGAVWIARDYAMGTAVRMGPGYFPTTLGAALALVGLAAIARSFYVPGEPIGAFAFKPLLIVVGSTRVFGAIVRGAGLAVALPAFILLGAMASIKFRIGTTVFLAAGLTLFCILVFVKGLGIPLPILGPWFAD
jgi:putative tricarboxylic transport membrane protein